MNLEDYIRALARDEIAKQFRGWRGAATVTYNIEPTTDQALAQAHINLFYPDGVVVVLTRGARDGWLVRGYLGSHQRNAIPKHAKTNQLHLGRLDPCNPP